MPCVAGSRCTAVPDHTPGPPAFTNHQCREVCRQYLHGTCGVVDPQGTSEMHRICHNCLSSRERMTSGVGSAGGTAGAPSEKRNSSGSKGKGSPGASGSLRLGQHGAKKKGGAAKRKRVSVEVKVNAIELLKTMSVAAVAAKLGIGESTVYSWKSGEKKLKDAAAVGKAGAKSTKGGEFPTVEKAVMELLTHARAHGLPVDRLAIQAFGRKAKATVAAKASTPAERDRLDKFIASEGWAKKFIARHNLKSRKLHGQAGSVDDAAIADGIRKVREMIAKYDPDNIINCDETALQYKMLPRSTYTAPGEDVEVCMVAQTQMFPKREAVQQLKDRLQAWCAEENRREQEDVSLPGGTSREDRPPRRWQAYEFIPLPSRNRTLDSEVLGMNVGRSVNDTRLEVTVDFEKEDEALEVGMRLLDMMADVSREPNEVFGYADDAVTGGQQLGPWKKSGSVNSWRKWLELGDGEDPLPESAVTVFRTVQANWADPNKIAAAMNFTVFWSNARMEESMADPTTPLRRVEVLHSALHPHVIKIAETFASSDAMLDHFHRNYDGYLSGVFNFRAAVNPTVQAYTPLEASLRPCLSATLPTGAIVPLVAIGGAEDGVSPPTMIVLEGLKLGVRHFVLEVGSSGVKEAVEGLQAALAFGVVKRDHLFVTMIVGESNSAVAGGRGIAAAVSETLASGRVDDGGIETDGTATRLLDSLDALVLARESGEYFDDDRLFLEMWDEAHQAAASPPRESTGLPAVPTEQTGLDTPADDDPFGSPFDIPADSLAADSPAAKSSSSSSSSSSADGSNDELDSRLGSHLGVGGHGSKVADRLGLLVDQSPAAGAAAADVPGTVPRKLPSLYFGDLRAGDGAATTATIDLCREIGVQAFSLEYAGGRGAEETRKGAAAAADYEHEDVTDDEVLAKWVMEIDGGVVWRPREVKEVARVLPLARYYLPPEWISEIADRGGCPPEAWARTLSRLCPSEGTPSEEQLGAEVEETVAGLMTPDDGEEADGVGDSYDGLWGMDDDE